MTGLLRALARVPSGQQQVGASLRRVHPGYHQTRQSLTQRQTNPSPYIARYFGEKLHIKWKTSCIWGYTHLCSGWLFRIMALLNANQEQCHHLWIHLSVSVLISNVMFVLLHVGRYSESMDSRISWEWIVVENGTLLCLLSSSFPIIAMTRPKPPLTQTSSKKFNHVLVAHNYLCHIDMIIIIIYMHNHIVERMWVEVNTSVNYPIKMILQEMTDANENNMDNEIHKYCTSWLTVTEN